MYSNIYIRMLDIRLDDETHSDGMSLNCVQHGIIRGYKFDDYIPWSEIEELVDEHLHSMHYS